MESAGPQYRPALAPLLGVRAHRRRRRRPAALDPGWASWRTGAWRHARPMMRSAWRSASGASQWRSPPTASA